MSEYSEKHSVAKLTGAAPGYVGYENGGQLTEAIKNKQHCVLLLDEIEKADQEVYNLFLQLFDEGRLTDSSGQVVNFKNVIVLMTSNIGAKQASEHGSGLGFVSNETTAKKSIIEKQLKRTFTPEFINRIDQIVYFNNLTDDNLKNIVVLEIEKFIKRLNDVGFNPFKLTFCNTEQYLNAWFKSVVLDAICLTSNRTAFNDVLHRYPLPKVKCPFIVYIPAFSYICE